MRCLSIWGIRLEPLENEYKTPQNLIVGCQSRVWLDAQMKDGRKIYFRGDSDAGLVKGIVYLLIHVLSGHTPDEF
jgi:cysteine desulfuration protein SufE